MFAMIIVILILFVAGLLFIQFVTRNDAKKERNVRRNYEGGSYRGYSKGHGQYTNR